MNLYSLARATFRRRYNPAETWWHDKMAVGHDALALNYLLYVAKQRGAEVTVFDLWHELTGLSTYSTVDRPRVNGLIREVEIQGRLLRMLGKTELAEQLAQLAQRATAIYDRRERLEPRSHLARVLEQWG